MLREILSQELENLDVSELESAIELQEVLAAGCGAIVKCGGCVMTL
jgi:hypothetical protein